jgi:hypothetical protein
MTRIIIYTIGIVACSVCAPKGMSIEEVTAELNNESPTGLDHGWRLSDDKTFSGGEPMPCDCNVNSDRIHYLFVC